MSEDSEPLLESSDHVDFLDHGESCSKGGTLWKYNPSQRASRGTIFLGLQVLLIVVYSGLYYAFCNSCRMVEDANGSVSSSPLRPLLQYHNKEIGSPFHNNPFVGEPGEEVDKAWHGLLENAHVRVSREEVAKTDKGSSIALADGSGFVAELAVYHYLHCLKWIKQNMHLDYYHPDWNEHQLYRQRLHVDHCIELLREALMCQADVSIMTFRWVEERPIPVSDLWSTHECVNWDTVEQWADERRINISEPGLLESNPFSGSQR